MSTYDECEEIGKGKWHDSVHASAAAATPFAAFSLSLT